MSPSLAPTELVKHRSRVWHRQDCNGSGLTGLCIKSIAPIPAFQTLLGKTLFFHTTQPDSGKPQLHHALDLGNHPATPIESGSFLWELRRPCLIVGKQGSPGDRDSGSTGHVLCFVVAFGTTRKEWLDDWSSPNFRWAMDPLRSKIFGSCASSWTLPICTLG